MLGIRRWKTHRPCRRVAQSHREETLSRKRYHGWCWWRVSRVLWLLEERTNLASMVRSLMGKGIFELWHEVPSVREVGKGIPPFYQILLIIETVLQVSDVLCLTFVLISFMLVNVLKVFKSVQAEFLNGGCWDSSSLCSLVSPFLAHKRPVASSSCYDIQTP